MHGMDGMTPDAITSLIAVGFFAIVIAVRLWLRR
jgi:hypothetical protein